MSLRPPRRARTTGARHDVAVSRQHAVDVVSSNRLTAADIVAVADRIIESDGVDALTMRRMSDELGVAVTSIYWHVGRRDDVIAAVIERFIADMRALTASGSTPRDRIVSIAREFRTVLLERDHLVTLAHQQSQIPRLFRPVRVALVAELAALGQVGRKAAASINAIEMHIVSSVLLENTLRRNPPAPSADEWPPEIDDPELIAAFDEHIDPAAAFDFSLGVLVDALVARTAGER